MSDFASVYVDPQTVQAESVLVRMTLYKNCFYLRNLQKFRALYQAGDLRTQIESWGLTLDRLYVHAPSNDGRQLPSWLLSTGVQTIRLTTGLSLAGGAVALAGMMEKNQFSWDKTESPLQTKKRINTDEVCKLGFYVALQAATRFQRDLKRRRHIIESSSAQSLSV